MFNLFKKIWNILIMILLPSIPAVWQCPFTDLLIMYCVEGEVKVKWKIKKLHFVCCAKWLYSRTSIPEFHAGNSLAQGFWKCWILPWNEYNYNFFFLSFYLKQKLFFSLFKSKKWREPSQKKFFKLFFRSKIDFAFFWKVKKY